jgi:DNA topoisomerase IB
MSGLKPGPISEARANAEADSFREWTGKRAKAEADSLGCCEMRRDMTNGRAKAEADSLRE